MVFITWWVGFATDGRRFSAFRRGAVSVSGATSVHLGGVPAQGSMGGVSEQMGVGVGICVGWVLGVPEGKAVTEVHLGAVSEGRAGGRVSVAGCSLSDVPEHGALGAGQRWASGVPVAALSPPRARAPRILFGIL